MRALVTGGTGLVGRRLVQALLEQGDEVCCMVRRPLQPTDKRIRVVVGDLLRPETLRFDPATTGPFDVVFHLGAAMAAHQAKGAHYSAKEAHYMTANADATLSLLETGLQHSIGCFVYMSGTTVIGRPRRPPIGSDHDKALEHPYIIGKRAGEMACDIARRRGMRVTSFRLSSPYGPGMRIGTVLPRFVHAALRGKPLEWHGTGRRAQDFIHVDDVAKACLAAVRARITGTYCLGTGKLTTMRELAELVVALVPGSSARASGQRDRQDGWRWEIDVVPLADELGFRAEVSLRDGLIDYVRSVKAGYDGFRWW
jgi:UDP-glucose 4-epimerase